MNFYKIVIKNHLIQGLSLQYFTQVPLVDSCPNNYQTRAAKYSLFLFFCVSESNSLENSMREAKSLKHFKSMLTLSIPLKIGSFEGSN